MWQIVLFFNVVHFSRGCTFCDFFSGIKTWSLLRMFSIIIYRINFLFSWICCSISVFMIKSKKKKAQPSKFGSWLWKTWFTWWSFWNWLNSHFYFNLSIIINLKSRKLENVFSQHPWYKVSLLMNFFFTYFSHFWSR